MDSVEDFENILCKFYGAQYAVATDCCTHAIELCLRYKKYNNVTVPKHTYLSVPMTLEKLNLNWQWVDSTWKNYYYIGQTNIIDAAVYWKHNGYIPNTFMCLSFQFKKHLNLGKGGMILTDDFESYKHLKKMSHDGRLPNLVWASQDVDTIGYHYYMTPETAQLGIERFDIVKDIASRQWSWKDYPDLTTMSVFK